MEQGQAATDLHGVFTDHWEYELRENPLMASVFYGDRRYDDRLPGAQPGDFARRLGELKAFQQRLQEIARTALLPADQLNYDLFGRMLENEIRELGVRSYLLPLNKTGSFQDFFADLPSYLSFATEADYQHYLARLRAFSRYVEEHIALMRLGLREGYVPPRAILEGLDEAIGKHVVEEPTQSRLWQPFATFPSALDQNIRADLSAAGRAAIMETVVPGYRDLLHFLRDEYLPAARPGIAASELPDGVNYYQHCIRYHTSLTLSPQQIHEIGLTEVRRIRAEMDEVISATGFTGAFAEFLTFLRTDDRFYVATPEALMKEVALILKRMDGELPHLFRTLPRMPYGIREVPAQSAPTTTTAYYVPPAGDGTRAGFYYVNTYDLRSRPMYELEALSLHEAVPGHHLQIALQYELGDLPAFRRFGLLTAYVEGWGLYAERLGLETGFYQDPYSNFGRLTYEMWRACRLVVDTGIHALGWTRQQAIDFMSEHTALTLLNIANEVDRYIAWPGQALAYKLGELTIRRLRSRAQQALGSRFDLRTFHDVVLLSGPVPLDFLDVNVEAWLASAVEAT